MQINLDRIRDEPYDWQENLEVPAASLERSELEELSPVHCEGRISYTDPGHYLRCRLSYRQTLICDRCLGTTEDEVSDLVERLLLTHENRPADELELQEQDMNVIHLSGEVFETEPLVVEQLQLNIPMKPLCRPDCAGLCPRCGADLNEGDCGCETETVDPRWAALAQLRDRSGDD